MAISKEELRLVSLNDLIAEIAERHDAFVFMGYRGNDQKGNYSSVKNFKGNHYICMGLLHHMMNDLDICIRMNMKPDIT